MPRRSSPYLSRPPSYDPRVELVHSLRLDDFDRAESREWPVHEEHLDRDVGVDVRLGEKRNDLTTGELFDRVARWRAQGSTHPRITVLSLETRRPHTRLVWWSRSTRAEREEYPSEKLPGTSMLSLRHGPTA